MLVDTFVDCEPLLDIIEAPNSQVIYGRRGTGKTHALKFVQEKKSDEAITVFIDLRSIGSNGSTYTDVSFPVSERATRLIIDVLQTIADDLYYYAVEQIDVAQHPEQITSRIDDLIECISAVKIDGSVVERTLFSSEGGSDWKIALDAKLSPSPELNASAAAGGSDTASAVRERRLEGNEKLHLEFGKIQAAIASVKGVLGDPEVWIFIDEWSEVPLDIQPYLADLFRKTILPLNQVFIKIAAIEHRSRFSVYTSDSEYIGMELGADISAYVSLDDFLVFDNDSEKATEFFSGLYLIIVFQS